MARIKHIALSTDDPAKTAEFYKTVFGLTELRREPADTGAEGVWLSDGYIYFAVLRSGGHDTPNLGDGASAMRGVHHIGFYVDDMDKTCADLEAASSTEYPGTSKVNRKYKGPDGVGLDVRVKGWDEQIKARMPLYQLTPAD
jgi:catechol 2,3-dioxygenase-like lactoylglutathione lyase family enzyme